MFWGRSSRVFSKYSNLMSKEANLKEKLRQALTSTVRVISDDLEIKTNPEYNKSSKKFDFFNLENLNSKSDFIKARADSDSSALKKKFFNNESSFDESLISLIHLIASVKFVTIFNLVPCLSLAQL